MTAGTGIRHSEFNPSQTEPVHLYQIWLLPERRGLEPGYEQRAFRQPAGRGDCGSWRRPTAQTTRSASIKMPGCTSRRCARAGGGASAGDGSLCLAAGLARRG